MTRKHGQVASGDFIVSISIFLFMLAIILPLYVNMSYQSEEKRLLEDIQTRSGFVTDSLLKTGGWPEDWNETNVEHIGLSDNGRINKTKIRRLMAMDPSSVKRVLGMQDLELNISFYNMEGPEMTGIAVSPAAYFYVNSSGLLGSINNSGLVWDLYYGGSGQPADGARVTYSGEKTSIFNGMIANSSRYRTLIVERPEMTQAQADIEGLKEFLRSGGILIYEGNADIISDNFLMHSGTGGGNGTARSGLVDAAYGNNVTFSDPEWYFYSTSGDAPLAIDIEGQTGQGLMGNWNYGIGKIYYITDIEGQVNGDNLSMRLYLIGKKAELVTGSMESAIANSRVAVLDAELNSLVKVVTVIGK